MNFVVPIQPLYRPYVLQAQQEGDLAWFVRGRVKLLLAFNEKESEVWLNIREGWSDGHE